VQSSRVCSRKCEESMKDILFYCISICRRLPTYLLMIRELEMSFIQIWEMPRLKDLKISQLSVGNDISFLGLNISVKYDPELQFHVDQSGYLD
jgi:hypothetical protein